LSINAAPSGVFLSSVSPSDLSVNITLLMFPSRYVLAKRYREYGNGVVYSNDNNVEDLAFFSEFGAQIMTDAHINVTLALTDARTRRVEESSFVQR